MIKTIEQAIEAVTGIMYRRRDKFDDLTAKTLNYDKTMAILNQLKESQEGMVFLPKEPDSRLKAIMMGEFSVDIEHTCSACDYHEVQEDCEVCNGEVTYTERHPIPWTTIKDIRVMLIAAGEDSPG